jgi:hypothetical protein
LEKKVIRWQKMAENGRKWLKIAENGPKKYINQLQGGYAN